MVKLSGMLNDSQKIEEELLKKMQEKLKTVGNENWFEVSPDIYAIPYKDGYVLYSPLQGLVFLITRTGFASLLLNESMKISDCLSDCLIKEDLEKIKLFDEKPRQQPSIHSTKASEFKPYRLTLSPTAACQLACVYCYIRGGDTPKNMPWEIAKSAIDLSIKNTQELKLNEFNVEFHGEGEPTANWSLFTQAVSYTKEQCEAKNIKWSFSIVTNGILNEEKISFIAEHNMKISVSLDGLKDTVDKQRPLRTGGSTFDKIMETLRSFDEKKVDFALRSTVTDLNIDEMTEFVNFIKQETNCKYINFEPVCVVGRGVDNKMENEGIIEQFTKNYRDAKEQGIENEIEIGFSTCRIDGLRSSFCGAYGPNLNFCISTDGLVSSCYEVLSESDPRADIFIYGKYNFDTKVFEFNKDRLENLLNLNVTKMQRCDNCFVRWNCGGDCLSKVALEGVESIKSSNPLERCTLSRTVTKDELVRSLFISD